MKYPLAETAPETVRARSGRPLTEVTLEAAVSGELGMEDLAISAGALLAQAQIARDAGRPTLARNFERAAELTAVPQEVILRAYELLRPGRAKSAEEIRAMARELRQTYAAERVAAFLEEAAQVYEKRGLFRFRY